MLDFTPGGAVDPIALARVLRGQLPPPGLPGPEMPAADPDLRVLAAALMPGSLGGSMGGGILPAGNPEVGALVTALRSGGKPALAGLANLKPDLNNEGDPIGGDNGGGPALARALLAGGPGTDPMAATPGPDYLSRLARSESGGKATAKNPYSSATGPHQFLDGTWLEVVGRHAPELAAGRSRAEILGLRTDPDISTRMAQAFTGDNEKYLNSKGFVGLSDTDRYMAHFLGRGGAVKFLGVKRDNPSALMVDLFPDAASANKNVFYDRAGQPRTVQQVYALMDASLNRGGGGLFSDN